MSNYAPKVNDYVIWKDHIRGWIYFKCEQYITIETVVTPKNTQNIIDCNLHKNNRVLILCYTNQWKELNYVKTRKSAHDSTPI